MALSSLQSKVTSLAHSEKRPPNITISPDVTCISIQGRRLHLDKWRKGLQDLFEDTKTRLHKLLRENSFEITIPADLPDDQTCDTRGYSWLDKGPFTTEPKPLMKLLLEDLANPVAIKRGDTLQWIPGAMLLFMQDASAITEQLAVLNHIINAPALRGVEFLDCKIRNSTLPRNYYIDHGQDIFITMWTKTDGPRDVTSYIPVFPPPPLQELNRQFLILVRPVEVEFAEKLWGKESAVLYREYFYTVLGSSLYPKFSTILSRKLADYAGIEKVGLHDWRQLAVAIKREFIKPEYDTENVFEDISDEVSGHTTWAAIDSYAVQHGYHPSITTDRLLRYRVLCGHWWNVCGFGKKLPVPLRLQSIRASRAALQDDGRSNPPSNGMEDELRVVLSSDPFKVVLSEIIGSAVEKEVQKLKAEFKDLFHQMTSGMPNHKQCIKQQTNLVYKQGHSHKNDGTLNNEPQCKVLIPQPIQIASSNGESMLHFLHQWVYERHDWTKLHSYLIFVGVHLTLYVQNFLSSHASHSMSPQLHFIIY
jgi:hypothetical protein